MPKSLGVMNEEPWYSQGLRFSCTQCGQCCTGAPGAVWVTEEEVVAIAAAMTMEVTVFRQQFIRIVDGRLSLNEEVGSYDCVFLKNSKCSIYDVRPLQCRTFPWWASNLSAPEAWQRASTHCEGICDEGELFTRNEIEQHANRTT